MKKVLLSACLALSLAATVTISGCKKKDDADVTKACIQTSGTSFETGETVTFTSCSENAIDYSWNFDDGNTSSAKNPTHAFTESGTYEVSLEVDGITGSSTATKTITVKHSAETYVGSYSASEVCSGGNDNYTTTITKTGATSITISNFYGSGWSVAATVNGNAVSIANQTIPNSGGVTVSGNGTLSANANLLILNYSLSDGTNNVSCTVSCTRQ